LIEMLLSRPGSKKGHAALHGLFLVWCR